MIFHSRMASPLGILTLACEDGHLTGLWMQGQRYFPDTGAWIEAPEEPVLIQTRQWLAEYFAGSRPEPGALPLAPAGTEFQKRVWEKLLEIPYGQTISYSALAHWLGCKSPQAVGNAVGRNPIAIVIPCHRVVGKNGSLTGYAGGVERKRWLLAWEGAL